MVVIHVKATLKFNLINEFLSILQNTDVIRNYNWLISGFRWLDSELENQNSKRVKPTKTSNDSKIYPAILEQKCCKMSTDSRPLCLSQWFEKIGIALNVVVKVDFLPNYAWNGVVSLSTTFWRFSPQMSANGQKIPRKELSTKIIMSI